MTAYHRDITVAPEVAREQLPDALIEGVASALRHLYAEATKLGHPGVSTGRVESWRIDFGRDNMSRFGGMLLTLEADVVEQRLPASSGFMEAETMRMITTRREDKDA